jgi:hypothetical protein
VKAAAEVLTLEAQALRITNEVGASGCHRCPGGSSLSAPKRLAVRVTFRRDLPKLRPLRPLRPSTACNPLALLVNSASWQRPLQASQAGEHSGRRVGRAPQGPAYPVARHRFPRLPPSRPLPLARTAQDAFSSPGRSRVKARPNARPAPSSRGMPWHTVSRQSPYQSTRVPPEGDPQCTT